MENIHKVENDVVEGGPLPNFLMVWYSLCLSIHPPTYDNLNKITYDLLVIMSHQWLEHPTGMWKVVGLILAKGSDFF